MTANADNTRRRNAILGRVRKATRDGLPDPGSLPSGPRFPTPDDVMAIMKIRLELAHATLAQVPRAGVASHIRDVLRDRNLPAKVVRGADARLGALDLASAGILEERRPATDDDVVGLSHAACAIAETGTMVLCSGPDNPTTINYITDAHIVVVERQDILKDYESYWETIDHADMPRAINFISGPSLTADIELVMELGSHGPAMLHVVVVTD